MFAGLDGKGDVAARAPGHMAAQNAHPGFSKKRNRGVAFTAELSMTVSLRVETDTYIVH